MRTQCQHCTSCIVFTSGSLRPVPMRSKRKSYQPSSNLQAIFWQTPSKYRGPHINDMRWKQPRSDDSRFMAQKSLRKRTPKWGPKFAAKTGALTKGLLCNFTASRFQLFPNVPRPASSNRVLLIAKENPPVSHTLLNSI